MKDQKIKFPEEIQRLVWTNFHNAQLLPIER